MPARLTFCGAAGGVTGSCYHLALPDGELLVDCGVFQGRFDGVDGDALNRRPLPFDPARLSGVVLTHGHLDHVGRLPLLARDGALRAPVVGHPATLDIARIIMDDSVKIAQHARGEPLYGADEVAELTRHLQPLRGYGATRTLGPFTIELFDAGHILGSSSVRVSWRDAAAGADRAILFSGDLGVPGAPIVRDPNRTWDVERHALDWVVTESTYGDKQHPGRAATRAAFRDVVTRALRDGGKVLIPAFALGRTQDILYELDGMHARGELSTRIPVIIDGPLALSATSIYRRHPTCYDEAALAQLDRGDHPLELDGLIAARDAAASRRAVDRKGPAIIIAGSGMCNGGRIRHHLREHLDDPRTDVLLVGYQAYGTLGRALQDGIDEAYLGDEPVPVRARVTTLAGFSAHGDRDALSDWHGALPLKPSALTFVTHGEPRSSTAYADHLTARHAARTHVPSLLDTVELT